MKFTSDTFGAVALAAYKPDWDLFREQLRSIQEQTHGNFVCIIAADGGDQAVREFVVREFGDDERFQVTGFTDRLGFYGNFERVIAHVPAEASWIALSDQDDSWYPEKLEVLIPQLNNVSMVSGQARVVRVPSREVVAASTLRKNVGLAALIAQNQFTGSLSIFRRDLLELALPFPRLETVTQVHDHWLAVCADCTGGSLVTDDVVQDYIQHGGNVLGEVEKKKSRFSSLRNLVSMSEKYRGGAGPLQMLRTANDLSFGWRRAMADTLIARLSSDHQHVPGDVAVFASGGGLFAKAAVLVRGLREREIAAPCFVEFLAGLPVEIVLGRRRSSSYWMPESTAPSTNSVDRGNNS